MRATLDRHGLVLLAAGALAVWLAADRLRWLPDDPVHAAKMRAAEWMQQGIAVLRAERTRRDLPWDMAADPNRTGLVGTDYSDLTTTLGSLPSKRTATNPNMAGLAVELLHRAGAGPGDAVAVGLSGSFPALNLAVLAACRALELRPYIVSSVGASSHGANEPGWTWPDMERVLAEHRVIAHRSAWVALGGLVDGQGGLDGKALTLGRAAIRASGRPQLDEGGRATLERDVERRLALYREGCAGKPRVFVNVGGALTSLGGSERVAFATGLIRPGDRPAEGRTPGGPRGLIARMLDDEVPVVHLLDVPGLAARYGLPLDPVPLPPVPDGTVMRPQRWARASAAGGLVALGAMVFGIACVGRRRRRSG